MLYIRKLIKLAGIVIGFVLIFFLLFVTLGHTGFLPLFTDDYQEVTLEIGDCNTEKEQNIDVKVAGTFSQKYVGLSRTSSLNSDVGMIFPFDNESSHRVEMRNMDFGLDIVFVNSSGDINSIKTVRKPESKLEYYILYSSVNGYGKYVIEMNKGWASKNNITEEDCIEGINSIK